MISFPDENALAYFVKVATEIHLRDPKLVDEMMKPFKHLMKQEGFQVWDDFAPWSFTFTTKTFNGGIIYEGPDSPADGSFPSLTVSLNPSDKPTWRIHT